MEKPKLTPKEQKFCEVYIETGNASEAYRQAYDVTTTNLDTIKSKASKIKKKLISEITQLRETGEIIFKPKPKPTRGYIYLSCKRVSVL